MAAVPGWKGNAKGAWLLAAVSGGLGCGVMAPLLPLLARHWQLTDDRAGLLLGVLFAGSFCGTLTLQHRLERSVQRGVFCAAGGMAAFALCTRSPHGCTPALPALALTGLGLGTLMSSVNLIAGRLPASLRTGTLARISAAWCVGAVASPLFAGERLGGVPLWVRLLGLAMLFLLCLADRRAWIGTSEDVVTNEQAVPGRGTLRCSWCMQATIACAVAMFLYGGVEACISGWLPMFVDRYSFPSAANAQWVTSAFWLGLIVSRMAMPATLSPALRDRVLKLALTGTALGVLVMAAFPRSAGVPLAFAAGGLVGPGFPLMFAGCLDWQLGTRPMAAVLAADALGAALCPMLLGRIALVTPLRMAIIFPAGVILLLPWLPWRVRSTPSTGGTREQMLVNDN